MFANKYTWSACIGNALCALIESGFEYITNRDGFEFAGNANDHLKKLCASGAIELKGARSSEGQFDNLGNSIHDEQ